VLRRQAHRRRTMGRRPLIALALALLCVVTVGEAPLARSPPRPCAAPVWRREAASPSPAQKRPRPAGRGAARARAGTRGVGGAICLRVPAA